MNHGKVRVVHQTIPLGGGVLYICFFMYYVVYALLYLISLLPIRVLYIFSDFAFFVVYHLIKYRKDVVMQNLSIAFPGKSEDEKLAIAKQFYKNFCDTFIETIKFISADERFFHKHFIADYSVIHNAFATGRSVQVHAGHNFNWELANIAFPIFVKYKTLSVYAPLQSKIFNRLFKKIRSRKGIILISSTNMKAEMLPHRNTQYILGLIADQAPIDASRSYWVYFFGKPTPFFKGPEKSARLNNLPVVFCHFTKRSRGFYNGHAQLVHLEPATLPEGQLTKMYAQYLEKIMTEQPEMWLWSHRRWKREWKEEYGAVL